MPRLLFLKLLLTIFFTDCSHCRARFCYACGKTWKTCPCDQFGRPADDWAPPTEEAAQSARELAIRQVARFARDQTLGWIGGEEIADQGAQEA